MKNDRAAILRRRAFYVGSALSALTGCPAEPPSAPKPTPTVGVEPAPSSALAPEPSVARPAPQPEKKMPPLDVPTDVNPTAKSHFEHLAKQVPIAHQHLDDADAALAAVCDITDSACDEAWRKVAKPLAEFDAILERDLDPRCPGSSADAKRFGARLAEHKAFMFERRQAIQKRIDARLSSDKAREAWKGHLAGSFAPRPCLDFSCHEW